MLRLYTGKMNVDSYAKVSEEDESPVLEALEEGPILNLEEPQSTSHKRPRDPQDNEDASRPPKRSRRIAESAPGTPARYYGNTVICFSCKKQGHTSQRCNNGKKCILCGLPEHGEECPNQLCSWCNNPGHSTTECKMPKAEKEGCYICGKDHDAQQCASIINSASDTSFCFNCGAQGHIGQQCQQPTMNELVTVPLTKVHQLLDIPSQSARRRQADTRWRRHSAPAATSGKDWKKGRVVSIEDRKRGKGRRDFENKRKRVVW